MARICVVDDEEGIRELVSRVLERDNHEVVTASDGAEGLAMITRENGDFDLVLSDIRMPVMDGIEMARACAERFSDLPIMLMTGFAEQREQSSKLGSVVKDVVRKPFKLADVRSRVEAVLVRCTRS